MIVFESPAIPVLRLIPNQVQLVVSHDAKRPSQLTETSNKEHDSGAIRATVCKIANEHHCPAFRMVSILVISQNFKEHS
jgi:hypothetical protein